MTPRLKGTNCKVFTFDSILSRNSQMRLQHKENQTKQRKMTRKPRSHVAILIYRTWTIEAGDQCRFLGNYPPTPPLS